MEEKKNSRSAESENRKKEYHNHLARVKQRLKTDRTFLDEDHELVETSRFWYKKHNTYHALSGQSLVSPFVAKVKTHAEFLEMQARGEDLSNIYYTRWSRGIFGSLKSFGPPNPNPVSLDQRLAYIFHDWEYSKRARKALEYCEKDIVIMDSASERAKTIQPPFDLRGYATELKCREEERNTIKDFIELNLDNGTSGFWFVGGHPGTGKTATVCGILSELSQAASAGLRDNFQIVMLNGLELAHPYHAFPRIAEQLLGFKKLKRGKTFEASKESMDLLKKHFFPRAGSHRSQSREMCVLVLDEVDSLVTQNNKLLYTIVDWCQKDECGLIVISIANTLDFMLRQLPRIASRGQKEHSLMFEPYTKEQIAVIIRDRLENSAYKDRFDEDAMKLLTFHCAVKGDIREALFRVKYTLQHAEPGQKITSDVVNRTRDAYKDPEPCISCVKKQTPVTKLILAAYVKEARLTEDKLVNLKRVYTRFCVFVRSADLKQYNTEALVKGIAPYETFFNHIRMLNGRSLLELRELSQTKAEAWAKSKLGIPEEAIHSFLHKNVGGWTWMRTNAELTIEKLTQALISSDANCRAHLP
jgi:Cdc6-like AAA superfamily ATPase